MFSLMKRFLAVVRDAGGNENRIVRPGTVPASASNPSAAYAVQKPHLHSNNLIDLLTDGVELIPCTDGAEPRPLPL